MNVLSLFDGISAGQVALDRLGVSYTYYASEIDKYAIKVTQRNYPLTIQLGDINNWSSWSLPHIDLLIGGSPCTGFSNAGLGRNFADPRSKLFFTYVDILKALKPDRFLLENVKMKKEWADIISSYLGVDYVCIDSALVSAQSRKRYYWTNIPNITKPSDKGIVVDDILLNGKHIIVKNQGKDYRMEELKSCCLLARDYKGFGNQEMSGVLFGDEVRKLTPLECERLQTFDDNYTLGISNTQRYKCLGNSFTVDVIAHILA